MHSPVVTFEAQTKIHYLLKELPIEVVAVKADISLKELFDLCIANSWQFHFKESRSKLTYYHKRYILHNAGSFNTTEMSEAIKCAPSTIRLWARTNKVNLKVIKKNNTDPSKDDCEQMRALDHDGMSRKEIAQKFEIGIRQCNRICDCKGEYSRSFKPTHRDVNPMGKALTEYHVL